MAQVPRYGAAPGETRPVQAPAQRTLASGEALSTASRQLSATGQALEQSGDLVSRVAIDMQQRDNADQVFRATTALRDSYIPFETEARQRQGRNAVGLTEETQKWWDEQVTRHGEGLANNTQRRLYEEQAGRLRSSSLAVLSGHEGTERRRSLAESAQASVNSAINLAAANPSSPDVIADARLEVDRNLGVASHLNGWTPEQLAAKKTEVLTKLHEGVIYAQVDRNPGAARAYYDAYKDEIAGTNHAKIEKALEIGGIRERTQTATEDILAKARSETEALELARAEYAGQDEDEIVRRIHERFNEQNALRQESYRQHSDAAWRAFDEAGGNLDAVPVQILNGMDPEAKVRMEEFARQRAESNAADVNTNWSSYDKFFNQIIDDPDSTNPNDWRSYVSSKDHATLVSLRNSMLMARGKPPPNVLSARSIADNAVKGFGLVGQANADRAGYVRSRYMTAISSAQEAQPEKRLSDSQMQEVADAVTKDLLSDPSGATTPLPTTSGREERNRVVNIFAGSIAADEKTASKRKDLQSRFKLAADQVLEARAKRKGSPLTAEETRAVLSYLSRRGSVPGGDLDVLGVDLNDAEGYYFEFLADPIKARAFIPDEL